MSAFIRVNKKRRCPVCDHPDWCGVSSDGGAVVCMRIRSERRAANGGWIHFSDTPAHQIPNKNHPDILSGRVADPDHRDAIYCALLRDHLTLSHEHRANLNRRGLPDSEIERNGYGSVPAEPFASNVARALSSYGLEGVPGFYRQGQWRMALRGPGFLIPVRDPHMKIQALQIRLDEGKPKYVWLSSPYKPSGASSGAPIHFKNMHIARFTGEAIITEGALKADSIAFMEECGAIGIAGVSTFPEGFGRKLKEAVPEIQRLRIAYDSDWRQKPQVRDALTRLMRELTRGGFKTSVLVWEGAKGYDDYLLRRAS